MSIIPQQSSTEPLDISLGIELEFMVIRPCEPAQDPGPVDEIVYGLSLVARALRKPLQLTCSSCGEIHAFIPPIWVQDRGQWAASRQWCWSIVNDRSIKLSGLQSSTLRSNSYEIYGTELASRVLYADRPKETTKSEADVEHKHVITYREEITGVLHTLHKALNSDSTANNPHSGHLWVTNKSCGFHVHVGNGSAGFPLQTIKNVLSVCTAFERFIDSMHDTTRIAGSCLSLTPIDAPFEEFPGGDEETDNLAEDGSIFSHIYNKSLVGRLISSAYIMRRNDLAPEIESQPKRYPASHVDSNSTLKQAASDLHIGALVEAIQQAPDLKSLQELLSYLRQVYVNIQHLVIQPGQLVSQVKRTPRLNTIEFRQHAGITDPQEALPWIDFVHTLVKYAHSQSVESVRSICALAASDPHLSLADMFDILGVAQQTRDSYLDRSQEKFETAMGNARAEVDKQLNFDSPLRAVALQLLDERAKAQNPEAVAWIVQKKFKQGGYGQFSRRFINVYAPDLSVKAKERLTIGWEAPKTPWRRRILNHFVQLN